MPAEEAGIEPTAPDWLRSCWHGAETAGELAVAVKAAGARKGKRAASRPHKPFVRQKRHVKTKSGNQSEGVEREERGERGGHLQPRRRNLELSVESTGMPTSCKGAGSERLRARL